MTAGLMWHPVIGPIVYTITSRLSPNAMAMPRVPTPEPAMIAVPHPPITRKPVPKASATAMRIRSSTTQTSLCRGARAPYPERSR